MSPAAEQQPRGGGVAVGVRVRVRCVAELGELWPVKGLWRWEVG